MITNLINEFYSGDVFSFYIANFDPKFNQSDSTCIIVKENKTPIRIVGEYREKKIFFKITEDISNQLEKGFYKFFINFKTDEEVKSILLKRVQIFENIINDNQIYSLTYNKKMLLAIESIMEGRSKEDFVSYTIDGNSITKMDFRELIKNRDYFKDLVEAEENSTSGTNKNNGILIYWQGIM